jgi:hypothetical protein
MTPTTTSMTPTTTSLYPTTTYLYPTTTSLYPTTTSMTPNTTNANTRLQGINQNGSDTGKYGYKMPQLNLYQKDYEGTSNVYSPYIYYNQENFTAVNQYDDTYCKY